MPFLKPQIIFEDNHLLVVDKPAGMLTQPDDSAQPSLLEICRQWLKDTYHKPGNVFLEAVHRLDKPASGIVLFAKTSKALSRLNASMRAKLARKIYHAKISGTLPHAQGSLTHHLLHGSHKAIIANAQQADAKEARLHYKTLSCESGYTLVEIQLETGRYHQIRAQFAACGCPLVGDVKYGGPAWSCAGIALHHACLEIPHPVGGRPLRCASNAPFLG